MSEKARHGLLAWCFSTSTTRSMPDRLRSRSRSRSRLEGEEPGEPSSASLPSPREASLPAVRAASPLMSTSEAATSTACSKIRDQRLGGCGCGWPADCEVPAEGDLAPPKSGKTGKKCACKGNNEKERTIVKLEQPPHSSKISIIQHLISFQSPPPHPPILPTFQ